MPPINDTTYQAMLEWRDIHNPCGVCNGSGVRMYGSTATWHGGMGGNACTKDICDKCWGSGDANKPWVNLRSFKSERLNWEKEQCLNYLASTLGITMNAFKSKVKILSQLCLKEANRRKIPSGEDPFWWNHTWTALSSILTRLSA